MATACQSLSGFMPPSASSHPPHSRRVTRGGYTGARWSSFWPTLVLIFLVWALPWSLALAAPEIQITANPASIKEDGGVGTFTIKVTDPDFPCYSIINKKPVNIDPKWITDSGYATPGADFSPDENWNGTQINVSMIEDFNYYCSSVSGNVPATGTTTINITAIKDNDFNEGNENAKLTTTQCQYVKWEYNSYKEIYEEKTETVACIPNPNKSIQIIDSPPPPSPKVTITSSADSLPEGDSGTIKIEVTDEYLPCNLHGTEIELTTAKGGTASENDYTLTNWGNPIKVRMDSKVQNCQVVGKATGTKEITIDALEDDRLGDDGETVRLQTTACTYVDGDGGNGCSADKTITIKDTTTVEITAENASQNVTLPDTVKFTAVVKINDVLVSGRTVNWSVIKGIDAGDLSDPPTTTTDAKGEASITLTPKKAATFTVRASLAGYPRTVDFTATTTNPIPNPTVQITPLTLSIKEGEKGTYTVEVSDPKFPCGESSGKTINIRTSETLKSAQKVEYTLKGWTNTIAIPVTVQGGCTNGIGTAKGTKSIEVEAVLDDSPDEDLSVELGVSKCYYEPAKEFDCNAKANLIIVNTDTNITRVGDEVQDKPYSASGVQFDPFTVSITGDGKPIPNSVVNWSTDKPEDATLSNNESSTGQDGKTSITLTARKPGTYLVTATMKSDSTKKVTFTATAAIDGVAMSIVSGNGQLATSHQPLEPFVVKVTSSRGDVKGLAVKWTLKKGEDGATGEGSFSPPVSVINDKGEASTVLTPSSHSKFRVTATLQLTEVSVSVDFSALASAPLANLPGLSPGQESVAGALDALCPRLNLIAQQRPLTSGERDLLVQCRSLIAASGDDPNAAVQGIVAITPEQASAPRKLLTQISSVQISQLGERLSALRRGATGLSLGGLRIGLAEHSLSGGMLEMALKQGLEAGGGASADGEWPFERLGIFITGNVQWGAKDKTLNEDGFDYDVIGLTMGADYRFTDGLILGTALGYSNTGVDIDADGGTLDGESWSLSLYGNYYLTDHFYLEGSATYGWDSYEQDRNIDYSLLGGLRTANSNFDGDQYTLLMGAGYDLILGGTIVDMFGRLQYTSATIDGYREQGASGLDLVIQGQEAASFKSILGSQVSHSISTSRALLNFQGWFQWEHEFEAGDEMVMGYFANDPNQFGFALPTDSLAADSFKLGLGLGAQFSQGRTAFIGYQATLGMQDYTEQTVTAGVKVSF